MRFPRRHLLLGIAASLSVLSLAGESRALTAGPTLYDGSEINDWQQIFTRITFNNLPPAMTSGSVDVPIAVVSQLGYNPNRSWLAGSPVSQILMVGDIQLSTVFGPQSLSLQQIANFAYNYGAPQLQQYFANLTLDALGISPLQSVNGLVTALPELVNEYLDDVAPVRDLFSLYSGSPSGNSAQNSGRASSNYSGLANSNYGQTIGEILQLYPDFGTSVLSSLGNLSGYGITSIPGLISAPLNTLEKWAQGYIFQIPGLADVPWSKFPIAQLLTGRLAMIDLVLGTKEGLRNVFSNTVTGSSNEGWNVACGNQSCSHVELYGNGFNGKRHIINPAQNLSGGFGILQFLNGGKEGTGWEPFGSDGPKVGVIGLDERTDSIQFGMYFYIDAWVFGAHVGRSPKFIGVPFFTASVKHWVPTP